MHHWLWILVFAGLATIGIVKPDPAKAWGRYAHLTVCDLAYRNFTPATRDVVNTLLQSRSGGELVKGRGRMADRRYNSFKLGCLEEDALPRRHAEPNCPGHVVSGAVEVRRDRSHQPPSCKPCTVRRLRPSRQHARGEKVVRRVGRASSAGIPPRFIGEVAAALGGPAMSAFASNMDTLVGRLSAASANLEHHTGS